MIKKFAFTLLKIIEILFAYLTSTYISGTILSFIMFLTEKNNLDVDISEYILVSLKISPLSFIIAVIFTIIPSTLFIIYAELYKKRSIIQYILFGSIIGPIVVLIPSLDLRAINHFPTMAETWRIMMICLVLMITGAVAGFTYWLIAGRKAGRFLNHPAK